MTQIVTVSPATAAYASQGMKSNTRASTLFEERIQHWSHAARSGGDGRTVAWLNVVMPPALALALITAPNGAQVTVAEAQRVYDENGTPPPPETV